MIIEIKSRWDMSVIFSCEAETIKLAVELAVSKKADLRGAYLTGAYLRGAYLTGAYLRGAYLTGAYLTGAYLRDIKHDFWAVLVCAVNEIPFLRKALIEGKVNGSQYSGECACLVGTIANAKKCSYDKIKTLPPNSSRPAERFFLGIKEGDTPETNQCSKLAVEWLDEFVSNIKA